jgi:hypothetical protein
LIMTIVSGAGLLISSAALAALIESLRQTRTVVRNTREIGEAQVRCYPAISDAQIAFANGHVIPGELPDSVADCAIDQTGWIVPTIWFVVYNSRLSPSIINWSVYLKYSVTLMDGEISLSRERQSYRRFSIMERNAFSESMLSSGARRTYSTLVGMDLDEAEIEAISGPHNRGHLVATVVIALRYCDVFKLEHTEEQAFAVSVSSYQKVAKLRMNPVPVLFFETGDEMRRRHEEKQRQGNG